MYKNGLQFFKWAVVFKWPKKIGRRQIKGRGGLSFPTRISPLLQILDVSPPYAFIRDIQGIGHIKSVIISDGAEVMGPVIIIRKERGLGYFGLFMRDKGPD